MLALAIISPALGLRPIVHNACTQAYHIWHHSTLHSALQYRCFLFCNDTPCVSTVQVKGKGSPYSITERRVPEQIPVLGSQPAGDVNHKPDGRLPLLSARSAVTSAILKRAATNFAAW